jgi:hypothetical protein
MLTHVRTLGYLASLLVLIPPTPARAEVAEEGKLIGTEGERLIVVRHGGEVVTLEKKHVGGVRAKEPGVAPALPLPPPPPAIPPAPA